MHHWLHKKMHFSNFPLRSSDTAAWRKGLGRLPFDLLALWEMQRQMLLSVRQLTYGCEVTG